MDRLDQSQGSELSSDTQTDTEMRIVASTASMLEEPSTENEEPFWIQTRISSHIDILGVPQDPQ